MAKSTYADIEPHFEWNFYSDNYDKKAREHWHCRQYIKSATTTAHI
jgi:hypothetical protein